MLSCPPASSSVILLSLIIFSTRACAFISSPQLWTPVPTHSTHERKFARSHELHLFKRQRSPFVNMSPNTTRLHLKREDLPEQTVRQLEEAEQRIKKLEEEYLNSLDAEEAAVERKCSTALACLKIGMLERAADEYIAAADSRASDARSWPLGLVLFFLDRYDEAVTRLGRDIMSFESQFEESATDERIWQATALICMARTTGADVAQARAELPELAIPERDPLRRSVYQVFRGKASPEDVEAIAASNEGGIDYLGVQFFSEVFLGLWHDAHGNQDKAKAYVLKACCSDYPRPDDLWYHTPRIHARARGWTLRPDSD